MKNGTNSHYIEALNEIAREISGIVTDTPDVMGHDDIYGFTANTNLGSIASSLQDISKTLEKIADIMVVNTELD